MPIAVMGVSPTCSSRPLHVAASASAAKPNATASQADTGAHGDGGESAEQRPRPRRSTAGGHGNQERPGANGGLERADFERGSAHLSFPLRVCKAAGPAFSLTGAREGKRLVRVLARCPGVLASGVPRCSLGQERSACARLWNICRIFCTNGAQAGPGAWLPRRRSPSDTWHECCMDHPVALRSGRSRDSDRSGATIARPGAARRVR
jgi:hypothetical protein